MSIPQSPTPPEPARPEDHQELVTFLERIFRPERMGSMAAEYPHLYAPELMPWNLVSRHCGRIVSVVGAFPIAFYIQSARPSMVLTVGGVGGVSTCPAHRGRGLMQAGLHTAIARMRDHEYAFSMLWGDRQRYAHFGYEDAGTELRGRAQRRQFPIGSGVPLDDWRPADPDSPEDMLGRPRRRPQRLSLSHSRALEYPPTPPRIQRLPGICRSDLTPSGLLDRRSRPSEPVSPAHRGTRWESRSLDVHGLRMAFREQP